MLRTLLSSVAPRATAAGRSLLPAAGRSPLTALASSHEAHQGGRSLALDCVAPAATASRSVAARKCSRRDMCSASAKVATSGSADTSTAPGEGSGDGQNGAETEMGSGQDARDPSTGEGIWMDQEDEVSYVVVEAGVALRPSAVSPCSFAVWGRGYTLFFWHRAFDTLDSIR